MIILSFIECLNDTFARTKPIFRIPGTSLIIALAKLPIQIRIALTRPANALSGPVAHQIRRLRITTLGLDIFRIVGGRTQIAFALVSGKSGVTGTDAALKRSVFVAFFG